MIFTGAARRTRTVSGSLEVLGTRLLVPVVACAAIVASITIEHEAGRAAAEAEAEAVNAVGVEIVSITVSALTGNCVIGGGPPPFRKHEPRLRLVA
jgi:hypothetical protein